MNITIMSKRLKTDKWTVKYVANEQEDKIHNAKFSYFELKNARWPECEFWDAKYMNFSNPLNVTSKRYIEVANRNGNNDVDRYVVNFYCVRTELLLSPCIDVSLFIGY